MSEVAPIVTKLLEFRHEGTLLDVASGFGQHAIFFAGCGFDVTALDIDALSLRDIDTISEEKGLEIKTMQGDVKHLDQLTGTWDIIVCTFVLHFLNDDEIEKAIKDIKALTNPGGLNVISAHTIENDPDESKPHMFKPGELKDRYSDWGIKYEWQGLGNSYKSIKTGEMIQRYRADIIVEKPMQ